MLLTSDAARARAEAEKRGAGAAANRGALPTYTVRAPPARGAWCYASSVKDKHVAQQAAALSGDALEVL